MRFVQCRNHQKECLEFFNVQSMIMITTRTGGYQCQKCYNEYNGIVEDSNGTENLQPNTNN
jgi:hypothetical protein